MDDEWTNTKRQKVRPFARERETETEKPIDILARQHERHTQWSNNVTATTTTITITTKIMIEIQLKQEGKNESFLILINSNLFQWFFKRSKVIFHSFVCVCVYFILFKSQKTKGNFKAKKKKNTSHNEHTRN